MDGVAIVVDAVSAIDTILNVKRRVYELDRKLHFRRQRLMYTPGPFGMDPLANNETLGGAGVAQDGSAKLDVLLPDLTPDEVYDLGHMVRCRHMHRLTFCMDSAGDPHHL